MSSRFARSAGRLRSLRLRCVSPRSLSVYLVAHIDESGGVNRFRAEDALEVALYGFVPLALVGACLGALTLYSLARNSASADSME